MHSHRPWTGTLCIGVGLAMLAVQIYGYIDVGLVSSGLTGGGIALLLIGAATWYYCLDDKRAGLINRLDQDLPTAEGVPSMSKAEQALRPPVRARAWGFVGIMSAHFLALCLLVVALVKIVPMYAVFFERTAVALPLPTQRLVMWSEFWVAYWFLLVGCLLVVDAALVLVLSQGGTLRRRMLSAYSHCCLLATCTTLAYIAVWLSHPVYNSVR